MQTKRDAIFRLVVFIGTVSVLLAIIAWTAHCVLGEDRRVARTAFGYAIEELSHLPTTCSKQILGLN
jgi:hypothetical protein